MADELNISAQFNFAKDNAILNAIVQNTVSITNKHYTDLTQDVLTTDTPMEYGSVSSTDVGFVMIQNIGLYDIIMALEDGGEKVLMLKAGTATEPGGIFMGYAYDSGSVDFVVTMQAVGTASRVSVRLIEN